MLAVVGGEMSWDLQLLCSMGCKCSMQALTFKASHFTLKMNDVATVNSMMFDVFVCFNIKMFSSSSLYI